jgi:uncharacterized protein (TIGR03435 family)
MASALLRLWPVLTLVFVGAAAVGALHAQQQKSAFEVASVKRARPLPPRTFSVPNNTWPGGRFTSSYSRLSDLIEFAYDIRDLQLTGGPSWVRNDRFDIVASAGREVSRDDVRLMLQALLADRFRLVLRKEQREMAIQRLVLDRSDGRLGPSLVKLTDTLDCAAARKLPDPFRPPPGTLRNIASGCGPLSRVAESAEREVGTIVQDHTDLTGDWFFRFWYVQAKTQPGATPDPNASPLPTAIREQLGLRLQGARGSVDLFVIESVEPPTDN